MSEKRNLKWKDSSALGELEGTEFDPKVKWSFYNLLPPESVTCLEKLNLDMFHKGEDELELFCNPTPSLNRVRLAFQKEFHNAKDMTRPSVNWHEISKKSNVSLRSMQKMFTTPKQLMWILCPIVEVHKRMEEVYYEALRKMAQALQAPMLLPDGTLDTKTFNAVNKIFTHLDKRQFGEFRQDIHIQDDSNKKQPKQLEDVEAELAEVNKRLKELGHDDAEVVEQPEPQKKEEDEQLKSTARERGIAFKAKKA